MVSVEQFASLSQDEQVARVQTLGSRALKEFGVNPTEIKPLAHFENTTFYVNSGQGEFNLRISRPGNQTDDALSSEIAFLAALRNAGFRVPEPFQARFVIASDPGVPEPRQVVLFRWMGGEFLKDKLGPVEARMIGRVMAELHVFATEWQVPEEFDRSYLHAWAHKSVSPSRMDSPIEGLLEADRLMMIELDIQSRATINRLDPEPEVFGLIHSDLHIGNVLMENGNINIIDFDDSGYGYFCFDLAAALAFHLNDPQFMEIREAMLGGYEEIRPLPPETRAQLNGFIRVRIARVGRWILERTDNPKLREVGPEYVHQFCEGLRRIS